MLSNHIRHPHAATQSLTFREVATAYNYPLTKATGKGCRVAIAELGGGFTIAQIDAALAKQGIKRGGFLTSVNVGSGRNHEDGLNGADGEVQSDILGVLEVAPDADVVVVFGGNTDADFYQVLDYCFTHADVVTLSWGGAEPEWDTATMDRFATRIQTAATAGVPLFVASGDSGSGDGERSASVDFPASAPASIACGGTRLTIGPGGARINEVTWDDEPTSSATGGGVSKHFPGRDVPDVAGNADPQTGYQVTIDGQDAVIGGTSLVAPLYAGLYALLWELLGGKAFDFRAAVIANPSVCFDVTSGNNGAFRAGPGRDETTGFGVVDGAKLLTVLQASTPTTPTPPAATPFPTAAIRTWLTGKHNHTKAESAAATAITAYATSLGINVGAT